MHNREEWSAAIVRAATAAELATNFAVRTEIARQGNLRADVVDRLLKDANGFKGKLDRLLVPLVKGTDREAAIRELRQSLVDKINGTRNDIVHRGEFRNEDDATETIKATRRFIEGLVHLYEPNFILRDQSERPTS